MPVATVLTAVVVVLAVASLSRADIDIVPAGSIWRFNDSGADLCAGRLFASVTLDDSMWRTGPGTLQTLLSLWRGSFAHAHDMLTMGTAPLGYGDNDKVTTISFGSGGIAALVNAKLFAFAELLTLWKPPFALVARRHEKVCDVLLPENY
jgi:hypothetical protein